jgi:hypothetical protein
MNSRALRARYLIAVAVVAVIIVQHLAWKRVKKELDRSRGATTRPVKRQDEKYRWN